MLQLDLDGREHTPVTAPPAPCAPVRLFNAECTIRGQMALQEPAHALTCPKCGKPARQGPHHAGYCPACFYAWRTDKEGT